MMISKDCKTTDSFPPNIHFFDLNDELKKVWFRKCRSSEISVVWVIEHADFKIWSKVSNWEAVNLTQKQQRSAATDAWALA